MTSRSDPMGPLGDFWPPHCTKHFEKYAPTFSRLEYELVKSPIDDAELNAFFRNLLRKHFAYPEQLAQEFAALGAEGQANYVRSMMPTNHEVRLGDLGEILLAEFMETVIGADVPLKRLRDKPNPERALHGADCMGLSFGETTFTIYKGESKGRAYLKTAALEEALKDLRKGEGLPSRNAFYAAMRSVESQKAARIRAFLCGEDIPEIRHVMILTFAKMAANILDKFENEIGDSHPTYIVALRLPEKITTLIKHIFAEAGKA